MQTKPLFSSLGVKFLTFWSKFDVSISSRREVGAVSLKSITLVSFLRMLCTNITPPLEKQNTAQALMLWTYPIKSNLKGSPFSSCPSSYPPIPDVWGWTIPKQSAAAMATSTLDPCFARTSKPRDVHWATSVTTAPWLKTLNKMSRQMGEKRKNEGSVIPSCIIPWKHLTSQEWISGGKQQT